MAYTAKTWVVDEVITAVALNNIEQGIIAVEAGLGTIDFGDIQNIPVYMTAPQVAGTASVRRIGTGATDASAGNHTHAFSSITGVTTIAQLPTGTTATTVALGNHTHTATQTTATAVGSGTATNVQGILAELHARILALETP